MCQLYTINFNKKFRKFTANSLCSFNHDVTGSPAGFAGSFSAGGTTGMGSWSTANFPGGGLLGGSDSFIGEGLVAGISFGGGLVAGGDTFFDGGSFSAMVTTQYSNTSTWITHSISL